MSQVDKRARARGYEAKYRASMTLAQKEARDATIRTRIDSQDPEVRERRRVRKLQLAKAWRDRQGDAMDEIKRRWRLRSEYGISTAEYDALMTEQEGACAICRATFTTTKATHIDHDHDTGQIRGILCSRCNTGLGKLGDNEEGLLRALAYLRANKEKH